MAEGFRLVYYLSPVREAIANARRRACEAKANLFPQFTVDIEDIKLKFAALYSKKPDAVPITLYHGWPGSYTEFLPMLQLFSEEFTPITLPYHLIVPSLPGCAFSWGPPLDRDFTSEDSARILDKLMQALGLVGAILHRVAILVPGCLGSWSLTMLVAKVRPDSALMCLVTDHV